MSIKFFFKKAQIAVAINLECIMQSKIYSSLLVCCFLLFVNCGGSDPTAEEKVTKLLTSGDGTWEPSNTSTAITVDGVDVRQDLFPGFTIRFTKDRIFTTGTSPVWLREDTWRFKEGSKATIIIRGMDDKEISIAAISSTELKLSLEWDQTTFGGRIASLPGLYEFALNK